MIPVKLDFIHEKGADGVDMELIHKIFQRDFQKSL